MGRQEKINFFKIAARLQTIICERKVPFLSNGYPDLTMFQYPQKMPEHIEVWPYSKRNQAQDPKRTIITFYEDDFLLYRDLNRIDTVIENLSLYYAATGFDISPCVDSLLKRQRAALLIDTLTNALIMSNGIHIIPSLRTGGIETVDVLKCYPRNICYAYGALGCSQQFQNYAEYLTALKLMLCEPSQLLVYGKLTQKDKAIFAERNIPIREFLDYQRRRRMETKERQKQNV